MTRSRELAELGSAYDSGNSMGFRNRIINGDMRIDQRNAGASYAGLGYALDRWSTAGNVSSWAITQQQVSDAPAGSVNSLKITNTAAGTASAAQFAFSRQIIEGFNIADLGWGTASAQTVTVSFWVKASITGTYSLFALNSAEDRSYVGTFAVSASNTWEFKTVTIPGDTSGTWLTNNSNGIRFGFDLGSGSNYQGTGNAWNSGWKQRTSGTVNFCQTSGATFQFTGVQLEAGSVASPFERVSYSLQLKQCQRYYWSESIASTQVVDMLSSVAAAPVTQPIAALPVMRAAPTCTAPSVNGSGGMSYSGVHASPNASVLRLNASYTGNGTRVYLIFNSGNFTASAEL